MNDEDKIRQIIEGLLLAAGKPLSLDRIAEIFTDGERPEREVLKTALAQIEASCADRGFELKKVASGYRFQVRQELSDWIGRLWEEKPQRYSRALLETLAIIAYRQPITRGDIEKIRGVAVSSSIIRTLQEREWVRIVGHRDVPGRPAMYASTRQFLDYFNLESLDQLPSLTEIRDLEEINKALLPEEEPAPTGTVLTFPDPADADDEIEVPDEAEAEAAAIGTRSIDEILGIVPATQHTDDEDEAEADSGDTEDESGQVTAQETEDNTAYEAGQEDSRNKDA